MINPKEEARNPPTWRKSRLLKTIIPQWMIVRKEVAKTPRKPLPMGKVTIIIKTRTDINI